jgi:hypothetical protein
MSLTQFNFPVHHHLTHRTDGLLFLLRYAIDHQHSKGWIGPLTLLLQRRRHRSEVPRG